MRYTLVLVVEVDVEDTDDSCVIDVAVDTLISELRFMEPELVSKELKPKL